MALEIFGTIKNSYSTLFGNRTVLVYVLIMSVLAAILVAAAGLPLATQKAAYTPAITNPTMAIASIVILFLVSIFFSGAIITAAGSSADIGTAAKNAISRYLPLVGTSILVAIIGVVPFAVLYTIGLLLMLAGAGSALLALGAIIVIVAVVVLFYMITRLSISTVGTVLGKRGPVDSVKHSWSATKGNLWHVFAIFISVTIVSSIIGEVLVYALAAAGLQAIGLFVLTFLGSASTIAFVRIYQALPG